ncbi:MAG TPA: type II secretion system F family protein [Candidatus Kapabacteria bacterium]|nr:type II secretion system F family protein [Candidatus Kapabacteria bacterium]
MAEVKTLSPFEQKLNDLFTKVFVRVSLLQKILFLDHLRIMIHGGLSLVDALDVLGRESSNKKLKQMIAAVKADVENGKPLSEGLSKHHNIFPPIYIRMIEAGETSGQLDTALDQSVIQMRKAYELTSSVRGAMIYPAVIVVAMAGIGIMMMTFVLPQITSLFKEFNAELPLATRILIMLSDFMANPLNLFLIFFCFGILIATYITMLKRSPEFRAMVHACTLRLPIFGGIIRQINLARFSLTLSSLLKSAIPVVDAVHITADTCSNMQYQRKLHASGDIVKSGVPLSETLSSSPKLFPPMVTEMVMVGEQSGEVEKLLSELANFYNDEVNKTMKNFTTIIEPVIIVVIGVAVAGMAVAVIMPMFTLAQNF